MPLSAMTALLLVASACDTLAPCASASQCPQLAGSYLMSWENAFNNTCGRNGPRPLSLTFTQALSTGGTTINGVNLSGSIFETNEFTMSGSNLVERYSLRGTVVATSSSSDAGTRIVGALTTTISSADGGLSCSLKEEYIGDKISK
jgi:hypothetical protein